MRRLAFVAAALLVLACGTPRAADEPSASPSLAGVGDPVRDGKFEFVVSGLACGESTLENGWLKAEAKGQYCVLDLSVTNIGTEPRHFADGAQKGIGPDGVTYAADTGAGVVANGNGDAVWNVVNPGIALRAKVVYDIPVGATIAVVELHDSILSGGVKVRL